MLLADLGADVIKVEPPAGDGTRRMGPYTPEDTERAYGGYFASVNRGKRSIVLDLKDPVGRQTLLDLVPTVDVLVENGRAGVMDRLGLGYETLAALNAKLVYAAIRGFGDPRTGESPYVHMARLRHSGPGDGRPRQHDGHGRRHRDEMRPERRGPLLGGAQRGGPARRGHRCAAQRCRAVRGRGHVRRRPEPHGECGVPLLVLGRRSRVRRGTGIPRSPRSTSFRPRTGTAASAHPARCSHGCVH